MNKILILGATGKLGGKLLNFCHKNNISITSITCFKNKKKLFKYTNKYQIKNYFTLSDYFDEKKFVNHINKHKFNLIYFLDYSSNSLKYFELICKNNKFSKICIANKEMIVAGGPIMMNLSKKSNNYILPLDSEHFSLTKSIFNTKNIVKIFITASGGPFYFKKKINIKNVKLKDVLKHPKWKMGINNSIDSSNFINKVLEIFELSSIFDIDLKKISFLISKSAYIHSVIYYKNSIISFNAFDNNMLIPLISPLNDEYKIKKINSNFNKIFEIDNFDLEKFNDDRFPVIKNLRYLKNLGHSGRLNFMLFNNLAQISYLNKHLEYSEIPTFIIKKLKKEKNNIEFKNIKEILNYIKNFYEKYEIPIC